MTTGALFEPKALAGSMLLTPLTEMVVRAGTGSAGLICAEVFPLAGALLVCGFCGGRAARRIPLNAANIRTVAKPRRSRRIKDSSESRGVGEFKARVSQLLPVLDDAGRQDGEAVISGRMQRGKKRPEGNRRSEKGGIRRFG